MGFDLYNGTYDDEKAAKLTSEIIKNITPEFAEAGLQALIEGRDLPLPALPGYFRVSNYGMGVARCVLARLGVECALIAKLERNDTSVTAAECRTLVVALRRPEVESAIRAVLEADAFGGQCPDAWTAWMDRHLSSAEPDTHYRIPGRP